jgi:predicted phage terminase large subunit-like protein
MEILKKIKRHIEVKGADIEMLTDMFDLLRQCEDKTERQEWNRYVRAEARKLRSAEAYELIRKTYVFGGQDGVFDDFCIALEWNRDPEKRFYLPRRDVLKVLVDDLQDLFDGKLDFLGVSLPPRVGKSTLCIFYMTFVMGHRPDAASVMSGHSDKLTDGFYRELLSIITDDTQYAWQEIFSGVKLVDNSAKNETIDLERKKRFPTMTCRSISGTLTGAVEIGTGGVLYCDDLVEDLEESLNPVRLQAKYDAYLNQLKDRKKLGAVELMVGTRWNVADPLGRIEEQYRDNPRYRFRVISALNEDGESNFNYKYGLGFDTEYYLDMKASIDDATWMAKYQGNPYIREGLLFPSAELRYFNGVLPDGEPDRKVAVVDTAWGGGDSLSMPILYECDGSWYLPDVVFNNGDKTVTRPLVIGKLKQHVPHMVRWESNNGGDEYGGIVDEKLREEGIRINMSYKKAPTTQSKLSRIIQYAPDIKKIYFLDEKHRSAEYEKFMREVTLFTVSGKNPHDDAPDSLAMLIDFLTAGVKMVTVAKRPF